MITRSGGQILSLLITVWQWAPEHIKKNLSIKSTVWRKFSFLSKKIEGKIFSRESQNPKSGQKIYNLGVVGRFFFVLVRS